jgi:hypothetical protein
MPPAEEDSLYIEAIPPIPEAERLCRSMEELWMLKERSAAPVRRLRSDRAEILDEVPCD